MSNWFHTMKHFARDDLYRNVLPLPYRVQIHMNLLDHHRPSVSQVSSHANCTFSYIQIVLRCPYREMDGERGRAKISTAKHANLLTISLHSIIIRRRSIHKAYTETHFLENLFDGNKPGQRANAMEIFTY